MDRASKFQTVTYHDQSMNFRGRPHPTQWAWHHKNRNFKSYRITTQKPLNLELPIGQVDSLEPDHDEYASTTSPSAQLGGAPKPKNFDIHNIDIPTVVLQYFSSGLTSTLILGC